MGANSTDMAVYGPQTHAILLEHGEVIDLQIINWYAHFILSPAPRLTHMIAGMLETTLSISTVTSTRSFVSPRTSLPTTLYSTPLTPRVPPTP